MLNHLRIHKRALLSLVLAVCAAPFVTHAAQPKLLPLSLAKTWEVFIGVAAPESYASVPQSLVSPAGAAVLPLQVSLKDDSVDIAALSKAPFDEKNAAIFYNTFSSDQAGEMRIGMAADYWFEVYVNGQPVYNTLAGGNGSFAYTTDDHVFKFPVRAGSNLIAVRVLAGSAGWRFVCGAPKTKGGNIVFEADETWRPVNLSQLKIVPGSALDQSHLSALPIVRRTPAGDEPLKVDGGMRRLATGTNGKLTFEGEPDSPVRLRGFNVNIPWIFGRAQNDADWKQTWLEQAQTARRQGYNMVRLSTKARQGTGEHPIPPQDRDKFDYLASVLGQNGIYMYFICTFNELPDSWHSNYRDERRDYDLRMYMGDPVIRGAWKNTMEKLMNHVNPYTGKAWKDDPTIGCIELRNEQEWGFRRMHNWSEETLRELDGVFQRWLEQKYETPAKLAQAWGEGGITSFADVSAPREFPSRNRDVRTNDFLLLCNDLSLENIRWMKQALRDAGYTGLISQYSIAYGFGGMKAAFEESDVSIANTYFRHPSAFTSAGSSVSQDSSVMTQGDYWRSVATKHFPDRPIMVTEFNHSFWNQYQYEGGLLFGAYSALQDFDALIIHEGAAFFDSRNPMDSFNVGRSPVLRASEFLDNVLFLRGDVRTADSMIQVDIPEDFMSSDGNSARMVSGMQNSLALLTGFRVNYPWVTPNVQGSGTTIVPDALLTPTEGAELVSAGGGWAVDAVDAASPGYSLGAAVAGLRKMELLPQGNITNPARRVFQSDTGEITMRANEKVLTVITPYSEAVALPEGKAENLGLLNVEGTTASALVAACAVDELELEQSQRIVLIYSTRVVNTGMEVTPAQTQLVALGKQPVLMQVGKLQATLRNDNAAEMELYALRLDGSRSQKLPLGVRGGQLVIDLDTATLQDGPTPFFELVRR